MLHRHKDEGILVVLCSVESTASSLALVGCDAGVVILALGVFGEEMEMVVP